MEVSIAASTEFTWTSLSASLLKFQNGKGSGRALWGKRAPGYFWCLTYIRSGESSEYLKHLAPCLAPLLFAQWKPKPELTKGFQSEGRFVVVRADGAGGLGSGTRVRRHSLPLSAPHHPHFFPNPSLFPLPASSPGSSSRRLLEELGRWLPAARSVQSDLSVVTAGITRCWPPTSP